MRVKEVSPYRMRMRPALIWPLSSPKEAPNSASVVWKVGRVDVDLHCHTESRTERRHAPRREDGCVHAMPSSSTDILANLDLRP